MKTLSFLKIHQDWYKGWRRVLAHVLFWLLVFCFEAFQERLTIVDNPLLLIAVTIEEVSILILAHYFLIYYAIPKLLLRRKWLILFLSIVIIYIIMISTEYYTLYWIKINDLSNKGLDMRIDWFLRRDLFSTLIDPVTMWNIAVMSSTLMYSLVIKITKDFFTSNLHNVQLEKEKIKLEKENLALELNFLKSQINPHFFFNTLNNIYALIVDKDEQAADIIVKLSDLMRYSLYESGQNKIPLKQELQFIRDYVALEKIRHKDHVKISLTIENKSEGLLVPPLVLITFIENAFKHGVNNNIDASWVQIKVHIDDNVLTFEVQNSKPHKLQEEKTLGGIGVMNVRRRLDLLYPRRYALTISNEPSYYQIQLNIQLHEKPTLLHDRRRRALSPASTGEIHPPGTIPDTAG